MHNYYLLANVIHDMFLPIRTKTDKSRQNNDKSDIFVGHEQDIFFLEIFHITYYYRTKKRLPTYCCNIGLRLDI